MEKESNMTRRYILIMLCLLSGMMSLYAQKTMRDVWLSMPEQYAPYLTESMRVRMLETVEEGLPEKTDNLLKGTCQLERITDDYLRAVIGKTTRVELKLFKTDAGETRLCAVKTLVAGVSESIVQIGLPNWTEMKTVTLTDNLQAFLPDTLSQEMQEKAALLVFPIATTVNLSEQDSVFVEQVSLPEMSKEDKQWLNNLLTTRRRTLSELLPSEK